MRMDQILEALQAGLLTLDEAKTQLAQVKIQRELPPITFKIAEKSGQPSVYGMRQQYPVTVTLKGWRKFLEKTDDFRKWLNENEAAILKAEEKGRENAKKDGKPDAEAADEAA